MKYKRFFESEDITIYIDRELSVEGLTYIDGKLCCSRYVESLSQLRSRLTKWLSEKSKDFEKEFYFRATDNKNEPNIINKIISKNSRDNYFEKGISVSEHYKYKDFFNYKYIYVVTGKTITRGSDGEPILDPKTIKVLSPLNKIEKFKKIYDNKVKKQIQILCKDLCITLNDYLELSKGNFNFNEAF